MTLKLYYHPLSSFCWKALIALYETGVPFEPVIVNLGEEKSRADFLKVWPLGKFPVIEDTGRAWTVPESTTIIEYLAQHCPGKSTLVPADPDQARQVRMRDRFFDNYIHMQMQKITGDRRRPAGKKDPTGVAEARTQMRNAYAIVEADVGDAWAMGDTYTMADVSASPALYYGNLVEPLTDFPKTAAYLERLKARPSFARTLKEAEPYFQYFPKED
jgi:glutathione S-transferase